MRRDLAEHRFILNGARPGNARRVWPADFHLRHLPAADLEDVVLDPDSPCSQQLRPNVRQPALEGVPRELDEAATIDGATANPLARSKSRRSSVSTDCSVAAT